MIKFRILTVLDTLGIDRPRDGGYDARNLGAPEHVVAPSNKKILRTWTTCGGPFGLATLPALSTLIAASGRKPVAAHEVDGVRHRFSFSLFAGSEP